MSTEDVKLPRKGKDLYPGQRLPLPEPGLPHGDGGGGHGGRRPFYGQVTDCDPARVKIGMPVELTFRRFHQGEGFYNYFWKLRPAE